MLGTEWTPEGDGDRLVDLLKAFRRRLKRKGVTWRVTSFEDLVARTNLRLTGRALEEQDIELLDHLHLAKSPELFERETQKGMFR